MNNYRDLENCIGLLKFGVKLIIVKILRFYIQDLVIDYATFWKSDRMQ